MDKLFKEQSKGAKDMLVQYKVLTLHYGKGHNGIPLLKDVLQCLSGYMEQIASMLKGAQAAQRAFKELLDMKQKQANIIEAHLARKQTRWRLTKAAP